MISSQDFTSPFRDLPPQATNSRSKLNRPAEDGGLTRQHREDHQPQRDRGIEHRHLRPSAQSGRRSHSLQTGLSIDTTRIIIIVDKVTPALSVAFILNG